MYWDTGEIVQMIDFLTVLVYKKALIGSCCAEGSVVLAPESRQTAYSSQQGIPGEQLFVWLYPNAHVVAVM